MNVFAEPQVLGGKLNALAIHNARLSNLRDRVV
jgi:hypothetical protein